MTLVGEPLESAILAIRWDNTRIYPEEWDAAGQDAIARVLDHIQGIPLR